MASLRSVDFPTSKVISRLPAPAYDGFITQPRIAGPPVGYDIPKPLAMSNKDDIYTEELFLSPKCKPDYAVRSQGAREVREAPRRLPALMRFRPYPSQEAIVAKGFDNRFFGGKKVWSDELQEFVSFRLVPQNEAELGPIAAYGELAFNVFGRPAPYNAVVQGADAIAETGQQLPLNNEIPDDVANALPEQQPVPVVQNMDDRNLGQEVVAIAELA